MIPFDLERAKKSVPMRTMGGHEARFIAHLDGGQPAPLVIEITTKPYVFNGQTIHKTITLENYYLNGKHGIVDSPLDLFMEY